MVIKQRSWVGAYLPQIAGGPPIYPIGGGFENIEAYARGPLFIKRSRKSVHPVVTSGGGRKGMLVFPTFPTDNPLPSITDINLLSAGTKAIADTLPTSPLVDFSETIGELRGEGLPNMVGVASWKNRLNILRGSSEEYLNYEFGWKPLLNEVLGLGNMVKNQGSVIDSYRSNSGKPIHVRTTILDDVTSTLQTGVGIVMRDATNVARGGELGTIRKTSGSRRWFVGEYQYHLPVGNSTVDKLKRYESYANKLVGTRITPSVLWNLSPWSWALDWHGQVGDVLKNVSALGHDGLVLKYGYVMNHSLSESMTIAGSGSAFVPPGSYAYSLTETKRRMPASPYFGFGINTGGYTTRQSAILTALGITKMSK